MKMKGMVREMFVLAVGTILVVLMAGCQEQQLTDAKKGRLVVTENIELKKQLVGCDKQIGKLKEQHSKEIERLKELHSKEIKRQEELLAKCQEEKKVRQGEKIDASAKGQMGELSTFIMELNAKLQEENDTLKAQIEGLKAQLAKSQQGQKGKE